MIIDMLNDVTCNNKTDFPVGKMKVQSLRIPVNDIIDAVFFAQKSDGIRIQIKTNQFTNKTLNLGMK